MSFKLAQGSPSEAVTITLPDPWAKWPWTRRLNPFHAGARAGSSAWIRSFELYSPAGQRAFDRCDYGLLASLAYPDMDEEQLRIVCDWLQVAFAFDDRVERKDERSAQAMASALMSGLCDGEQRDVSPETKVWGAISRDFWKRLVAVMPEKSYQRRFVSATQRYTDAVVQEARDHHRGQIRSVPDYLELRRGTVGVYSFWVLLCMGLDLPDEIFDHPIVQEIEQLAADLIIVCNDIVSYKPESSRGESHNLIATLKTVDGLSTQEAMDWAGKKGTAFMKAAHDARSRLPTFGEDVDRDLAVYVGGLCDWVRACDAWNFETPRYFGRDGASVLKHRQIVLSKAVHN